MRIILTCFLIASVLVASDAWIWGRSSGRFPAPANSGSRGNCNNVKMVTRMQWRARSPRTVDYMPTPVSRLFIHHTTGSTCSGRSQCDKIVKNHQNYHMDSPKTGYYDIGYNFLISNDGLVYEGRGWTREGSHTKYYNRKSVAFSFIGNFETATPTAASLQAAKDLIDCGIDANKLTTNFKLQGHKDVKITDCPGRHLYNEIKTWPEYS